MIGEFPSLDIFRGQTSKRLFFAKTNLSDTVWHILDFAISQQNHGKVYSIALHKEWVYPAISADTVDQMDKKSRPGESICSGCLETFEEAKEIIKDRKMLKFSDSTIREEESPIIIVPG